MTKKTTESGTHRLDGAQALLSNWQTHYWDSCKLLAQAWAFYYAIMAALIGYVMTRNLPRALSTRLVVGAMAITVVQVLGATIWGWGLLKVVAILEGLNREVSKSLFNELELRNAFLRWRRVQVVVMGGSAVVAAFIFVGLTFLLGDVSQSR